MNSMLPVLVWVIARLKEPSSYGGLGLMLAGMHLCTNCDGLSAALIPLFMAVAGLAAFLLPESK